MTPRLLITGSGRNGTGYIAELLNRVGVPCGHEGWWNPLGERRDSIVADASWCALAMDVPDDVVVVHQMRHPLDVVSSEAKCPTDGPYRELLNSVLPWVPNDPLEYGMLAWFTLTELAQKRATWTYRLDDVSGEVVQQLAGFAGRSAAGLWCMDAVNAVRRDVNWHGDGPRYGWVDLPKGGLRDALMDYAKSWGWT